MHSQARRRVARAGADSALYTSDSETDTSQKSKFNNSSYLLRICRSSAPAIRATPATMQFIIHNDAAESPQPYQPWFVDHPSSTSWGIGPPPPFQGPDVGRHRAELTTYELSGAACLEHQHRSSVKKATRRATTPAGAASSKQRARGGVA